MTSTARQSASEFSTDRYDAITSPQRPSVTLIVDMDFEIFTSVTVVKGYPTKRPLAQERHKKMRFDRVRLNDIWLVLLTNLPQ